MTVRITKGGVPSSEIKSAKWNDARWNKEPYEPNPDQWEVYGRLKVSKAVIAMSEGISMFTVNNALRRPEIRQAYEKGRAMAIIGLRQKQLSVALSGSERMLIYCGKQFGDQHDDPTFDDDDFNEQREPSRHTWEGELHRMMEQMAQKVEASGGD